MRAFSVEAFGEPGSIRDLPTPDPAEGEVLVRVGVAGINPVDNAVIRGYLRDMMEHRFPLVPGADASGVVDAVGEGVVHWSPGDEVFGVVGKASMGGGTLAELVTMSAGTIARRPAAVDRQAAAALPLSGVTALAMIDALALEAGQTVLAIGATGGVGSYFVQLARGRGARVVAVCRAENAEYARGLGAQDVIDYRASDVADALRSRYPGGIDAIADLHGDRAGVARLAEQVRAGGAVASAVGAADEEALASRGVRAANVAGLATTASLEALARMLEAGDLVNPEIRSYPFAEAGEALAAVATGHVRGKLVVEIG